MDAEPTKEPAPHALERAAAWASLALVAAVLLARLPSFGIWDPWEIEIADAARRLAEGATTTRVPIGTFLVSRGFLLLDVDEWTGRLPIALCGVLLMGLTYVLLASLAGRRTAVYGALIAGTSPLLVLNARTMLGEAPTLALQTAIVTCGVLAVGGRMRLPVVRLALLGGTLVLVAIASVGRGVLLGALAPLAAVACFAAAEGKLRPASDDRTGRLVAIALWGVLLGLVVLVAQRVLLDRSGDELALGGAPIGGQPPGFDVVLERALHAFVPWSGLLPLALAFLTGLGPATSGDDEPVLAEQSALRGVRVLVLVWLGVGYAALTLFLSRYGRDAAVLPVTGLAIAVAMFLREVEQGRAGNWVVALCAALGVGLMLRDFAMYPVAPLHAMSAAELTVPEGWNARAEWSLLLGVFGGLATLALGVAPSASRALDLRAPYRLIAAQFSRGIGFRIWLVVAALVLLALLGYGVMSWVAPKLLRLTTLGVRIGKAVAFAPAALPLAVALLQVVHHAQSRLGRARMVPLLCAGVAFGGYTGHRMMPALSTHFSPREVYEAYNELARADEPLIEFHVGARTAAYYAKGESIEADSVKALVDQLAVPERRWAVLPAEELAAVNRMFRNRTGKHLFVANASSSKALLATNRPIAGTADKSFLTANVLRNAPSMSHPLRASFEGKIELLGYDLKLPHRDHVGAGERIEITWYWKAVKPVPGSYRIFVHVDGPELRIHGDHDPVDGKYPVRLWDPGDVIKDHQKLDVPSNYPDGDYGIFVGFYAGETRLAVTEGPKDDANRARAGVLRIR